MSEVQCNHTRTETVDPYTTLCLGCGWKHSPTRGWYKEESDDEAKLLKLLLSRPDTEGFLIEQLAKTLKETGVESVYLNDILRRMGER